MKHNFEIVVGWHNSAQRDEFLDTWSVNSVPDYLRLVKDEGWKSCALTKNKGIEAAVANGAEYIIVMDDDCYPAEQGQSLMDFAQKHIEALKPQEVRLVVPTTIPAPRGMPYRNTGIKFPVAACMGFWLVNPDFDAMSSLVNGPQQQVSYMQTTMFGRYFPFSGMNYSFHRDWADCAVHINVPRFDDIWMGWVWQKVAYSRGACFNLKGPLVNHVRQSDVWKNFEEEAKYLQINETLWANIHQAPTADPKTLRELFTV